MKQNNITTDEIRMRVGDRSFERGRRYFKRGAITNPRLQGDTLKADCWGSMPEPYRVWVEMSEDGIDSAECSCPVGNGGHCKHIAALLLTWLHNPERFVEIDPIDKVLNQRAKSDLIQLIQHMVARAPDLEDLIYVMPIRSSDPVEPINPELIRHQVTQALNRGDYGHGPYGVVVTIVRELETILQQAEPYKEQNQWSNAATIYGTVLSELMTQYTQIYDHDGDLGRIFDLGSVYLGECLDQIDQTEVRSEILHTLVDVIVGNINLGGYGFADSARDIVLAQTETEERQRIVTWVEDALEKLDPQDKYREWPLKAFGQLLLDLQDDILTDDQYIHICRRTLQLQKLVERLLQLGCVVEAITDTKTASDYGLPALADLFVEYGHDTVAERLVWERTGVSTDSRLDEWLKNQAVNKEDWPQAIQFAETLFWQRGSVKKYQDVQFIAEEIGDWPERREGILTRLSEQAVYELLTRIYLSEDDIAMALSTVPEVRYFGGRVFGYDLVISVANAAEATHPREAIHLYLQVVDQLIAARGRDNYAVAAEYLCSVKKLYYDLDEADIWKKNLQSLRNHKPRLPAMLDELKRAGL